MVCGFDGAGGPAPGWGLPKRARAASRAASRPGSGHGEGIAGVRCADDGVAGPHVRLPCRGDPSPGQRHHPETPLYGRIRRQCRPGALPDRSRSVSGEPRQRKGRRRQGRSQPACHPVKDRTLQGIASRQSGQPAGLRRRGSGPEADGGRYRVLEGDGPDGPHQPGLYPDHRPHLRPHRQIQRDGRCPGDGAAAHAPVDHSATRPRLRGRSPIHHRTAAPEALAGGRPPEPGWSEPEEGHAPPGRRIGVSIGGDAPVPGRNGGSVHRLRHPADRLSQSEKRSPAGHVRPGGGPGRDQGESHPHSPAGRLSRSQGKSPRAGRGRRREGLSSGCSRSIAPSATSGSSPPDSHPAIG